MRSLLLLVCLIGCGTAAPPPTAPGAPPPLLVGPLTREEVMAAPKWQAAFEAAEPDAAAARALGQVPAGAEIDVYFGTWCPDSRYEVSRFWKSIDELGGKPPFTVKLIGVDRQKHAPEVTPALDLKRVPTFVVRRSGVEVGRIVEHAPRGIETELADLLLSQASGN